MNNDKKLQVIIDDEQIAKARAAITASMKEEYNKSTQDWAKVEEDIITSYQLHKEFGPLAFVVFYIEPEDEAKAVETCRDLWPDAVIESGSGEHDLYGFCHYVQVTFNQLNTTDK